MIKDMTSGKPAKVLIMFSLPMLLSMVFQQMYNVCDSIVAGQFIGKDALAAVGASYPITILFIAIATGASVGASVVISQLFGVKSLEKMKTAVWTSIISIMTLAVVLTAVGFLISAPISRLLKTPGEILDDSLIYLNIYIAGLCFLFLYNAATAIFNGLGDSRTPLYFLIFSSILNVFLDILFVTTFKMGIGGLAWATFIAQGISGILAIVTLLIKISRIKTESTYKKFDTRMLKKISSIAVPSILQQSFVSVGQLCVQGVVNSFGTDTVAAYASAMKVSTFAVSIFNTMSSALSSYTAQNIGAGNIERVKQGYKSALVLMSFVVLLFMCLMIFMGKFFVGLFVNNTDSYEVIKIGQTFLMFVAFGYPFVTLKVITDGVVRGAGYMIAFVISTFSDLIVRVVISIAFAPLLGFTAICISFPIGWLFGAAVSMVIYSKGKWKNKKAI